MIIGRHKRIFFQMFRKNIFIKIEKTFDKNSIFKSSSV